MSHLSLCSGIGGLDLALGTPDVFYEIDPAPSEVLGVRFPGVSNAGDWTELQRFPDDTTLISGGLPCQPLSGAGKGKTDNDERYLFDDFIRILQASGATPTVVLENVRGILYPRNRVPFARLIRGLADIGYGLRWECVRASDIGAPHRRERWFGVATHPDGIGPHGGWTCSSRRHESTNTGSGLPAHTSSQRQLRGAQRNLRPPAGVETSRGDDVERCGLATLGASKYGPAVARWEALTRPAPAPLDGKRLAPEFVEWMMGYPEGYVTDILPQAKALKALGNAVVPQQAALALDLLARAKVVNP